MSEMWEVCLHMIVLWSVSTLCEGDVELDTGVVIHESPGTVIARKSFPFMLNCSATSGFEYRPVNYTWHKNGRPVQLDKRVQIVNNGSLYFQSIKRRKRKNRVNDQGFYECFLTNSEGTVIGRRVKLEIAKIAKKFAVEPKNQNAFQGGVARFECNIASTPTPRYNWKKDRNSIPRDSRFTELVSGVLQIDNVRPSDAGNYYCSAHQSFSSLVSQNHVAISSPIWRYSQDAVLSVVPASGSRPPTIVKATKEVNATVDTTVMLECFADGDPKPTITWQKAAGGNKADYPVLEDVHKRRIGDGNLKFIEVSEIDEGVYKCTASSPGYPDAVAEVHLNVLVPPKIIKGPTSAVYPVALRVRFPCEVFGKPRPKIKWYKNGKEVQQDGRLRIIKSGLQLVIESRKSDSGYYQCIATNSVGSVMATGRLKITLRENAPFPPEFVTAVPLSSSQVNVSWSQSKSLDCCAVMAYVVHTYKFRDNKKDDLDHQTFLTKLSQSTSIIISDLQPFTEYKFYVRAYSAEGSSQDSDTVIARTLQGVPSGAPSVNLSSATATSIDVRWGALEEKERNGIITKYKIVYKEEGKAEKRQEVSANTYHYVITGLLPEREYSVRVLAGTSMGYPKLTEDEWPWIYQVTRSNISIGLPTPKLNIMPINASTVNVSWLVETTTQPIKAFRLFVRQVIGPSVSDVYPVDKASNHYLLTGLVKKMFYEITLMVEGKGTTLGIVNKQFQALEPNSPPEPPPPSNIDLLPISSSTILVTWSRPRVNMEITDYQVKYHKVTDIQNVGYKMSDGIKRVVTLDDLEPFTTYSISIRSRSHSVYGPYSNTFKSKTKEDVPDAPEDIRLVPLKDGMVQLNWKPPSKQNGVIIFYVIQYNKKPDIRDDLWKKFQKNGTITTAVVSDLTETVYYFKVRACTRAGMGPSSDVVQIKLSCPLNCNQQNGDIQYPENEGEIESGGPLKDQRLGIIIGCTIGLSSILICILVIVLRQRHYAHLYHQSTRHIVTMNGGNVLITGNNQRYIPNPNVPLLPESDPSRPMLHENMLSDSKGPGPDQVVHKNGQVYYKCNSTSSKKKPLAITESSALMSSPQQSSQCQGENSLNDGQDDSLSFEDPSLHPEDDEDTELKSQQDAESDHFQDDSFNDGKKTMSENNVRRSSHTDHTTVVPHSMTNTFHSSSSGSELLSKMMHATSSNLDGKSSVSQPHLGSPGSQKRSGLSYGSRSHKPVLPHTPGSKA